MTDGYSCGTFVFSMDVQLRIPLFFRTRHLCILHSILTWLTLEVVLSK
jgi:hypothetical protein